jgi:hypothetical protein
MIMTIDEQKYKAGAKFNKLRTRFSLNPRGKLYIECSFLLSFKVARADAKRIRLRVPQDDPFQTPVMSLISGSAPNI